MCFFEKAQKGNYWDARWGKANIEKIIKKAKKPSYITRITEKYLSKGAKIIEGGCGLGQKALSLKNAGYEVVGVDNAKKAIERGKLNFSDLDIMVGDLRQLDFSDRTFDGYWSIGVIEHDINGFDEILKEMRRVLKPEGYLFLSFPFMSGLRKLKAKHGSYPLNIKNLKSSNFYQYIYDVQFVLDQFERNGFFLIWKDFINPAKGLSDEIKLIGTVLDKNYRNKMIDYCAKVCRIMINIGLNRVFPEFSSHVVYLVFQKGQY